MEDNRKRRDRPLQRCCQCHRLEEQLWTAAYEEIWPVVRRRLAQRQTEQERHEAAHPTPQPVIAKGA